jgi:hypothetical protein
MHAKIGKPSRLWKFSGRSYLEQNEACEPGKQCRDESKNPRQDLPVTVSYNTPDWPKRFDGLLQFSHRFTYDQVDLQK